MSNEKNILVSIIVPAYNVEEYIGPTLESICKNKMDEMEFIVIDDGSKDNTRNQIEECLSKLQPLNYKYIKQKNAGVSAARNAGIDQASGKYLIFCDGDDICSPNMIEEIVPDLKSGGDLFVWGFDITQNGIRTVGQGEFGQSIIPKEELFKSFLFGKYRIRLGSFAISKEFLEKTGIRYTVGCPLSQDVEFMYKCLAKVEEAKVIDKILFTYAKREGSVMYTYNMNRFEAPRAMKRVLEYVEENTDILQDAELNDYLRNGFLIQHGIFAFDACIKYLTDRKRRKEFLRTYYTKYSDVEAELKRACKEMKKYPVVASEKKVKVFQLGRSIYVILFAVKMLVSKR